MEILHIKSNNLFFISGFDAQHRINFRSKCLRQDLQARSLRKTAYRSLYCESRKKKPH